MSKETGLFILGVLAGLTVGFLCGAYSAGNWCEAKTIKDGKAEYYLDENYNKKWRWK